MQESQYLSLAQVAKILGISRIAVYKKVKKGVIKAIKIGRSYAVSRNSIADISGSTLKETEKQDIDKAVKRVVREYGEVLKRLGNE